MPPCNPHHQVDAVRRKCLGSIGSSLLLPLSSAVFAQEKFKSPYPHAPTTQGVTSAEQSTPQPTPQIISATPSLAPNSPYPPFRVISVSGEVKLNRYSAHEGKVLTTESEIHTGKDGSIVYRWWDEIVKLYPNSYIKHGMKPERWAQLDGKMLVASKQNQVPRVVFTNHMAVQFDGSTVYIDSSQALYSANGNPVRAAYTCVCVGQALLARSKNKADVLQVDSQHHNRPYFITKDHYRATSQVIGHSDQDVVLLRSMVNQIG